MDGGIGKGRGDMSAIWWVYVGAIGGMLVMAFLNVRSYDRGYKDGLRDGRKIKGGNRGHIKETSRH